MPINEEFLASRSISMTPESRMSAYKNNSLAEERTWGEALQSGGASLYHGARQGLISTTPEQFYRFVRTVASFTGAEDIHEWATEGVKEMKDLQANDPFYKVNPNWVSDGWGRSLYEGANSLVSSLALAAPVALGTMALPAAAPLGVAVSGASLGAGFFGLAFGGATIGGLAEYDSFVDEAYEQLKPYNSNITRADMEDQEFWYALLSGISEAAGEFGGDMLGGKLTGLVGKAAVRPARSILQKLLFKGLSSQFGEVSGEMATAMVQDWARQTRDMAHQGTLQAAFNVIGPTLVSGGLSGIARTAAQEVGDRFGGDKNVEAEDPKDILNKMRTEIDEDKARRKLGDGAFDLYAKLTAADYNTKQATFIAAEMENQAVKWAEENNRPESEFWEANANKIQENMERGLGSRMSLIETLGDKGADLETVVDKSMEFLQEDLDDTQKQAVESIYGSVAPQESRDLQAPGQPLGSPRKPIAPENRGKEAVLETRIGRAMSMDKQLNSDELVAIKEVLDTFPEQISKDLALSVRNLKPGDPAGRYWYPQGLIEVFTGASPFGVAETFSHEFGHRVSEFVPEETFAPIRKEFERARTKYLKNNPEGQAAVEGKKTYVDANGKKQNVSEQALMDSYRFMDSEEYFAERLRDIFTGDTKDTTMDLSGDAWTEIKKFIESFKEALIKAIGRDRVGQFVDNVRNNRIQFKKDPKVYDNVIDGVYRDLPTQGGEQRDLRKDLTHYIRSGRKAPKGLEMTPELSSAFRNMRDRMLETYGVAKQENMVSLKPETLEVLDRALGNEFTPRKAPSVELFTMKEGELDTKKFMEDVRTATNPNKVEAFVEKVASEVRLNLDAWDMDDPEKALMGAIHKQFGEDFEDQLYGKDTSDKAKDELALKALASHGLSVEHMQSDAAKLREANYSVRIRKAGMTVELLHNKGLELVKQYRADPSTKNLASARVTAIALGSAVKSYRGLAKEAGDMLRALRTASRDRVKGLEKMQQIIEATGGQDANELWINALLNADTPEKQKMIMAEGALTKTISNMIGVAVNGMLINPKTHVVGAIGNGLGLGSEVVSRAIAAQDGRGVQRGEARAMMGAAATGFLQSIRAARLFYKTGESQFGPTRVQAEIPGLSESHDTASGGLSGVADLMWNIFRAGDKPVSLLGTVDEFFQSMAFNMELAALKHRTAMEASGGDKNSVSYGKMLKALESSPPNSLKKEALEFSKYVTYKSDIGDVGKFLNKMRLKHPATFTVIPFIKAPINIWKWGGERTPGLANMLGEYKEHMNSGDPARMQLADARLTMGSLLWTTGLSLAAAGFVTGPDPVDAEEREKLRATGWQPNSLKIGDRYFRFDRADPLSFIFLTGAAVSSAAYDLENDEANTIFSAGVGASIRALSDRTYIEGLVDFFEMINDPEKRLDGFLARRSTMFIPYSAELREVRRQMDPVQREAQGIIESIMNSLPGFSEALPVRYNYLGEPVKIENTPVISWFNPFAISTDRKDPLADEMYRLYKEDMLSIGRMGRTLTNDGVSVKLTGNDYSLLQQATAEATTIGGQTMRESLMSIMSSPEYEALSDEDRGVLLEATVREYRGETTREFKKQRPELWLVQ